MATEVQWSELQRDPKSVAALADQGDVLVRRRDGASLLLVRADRARSAAAGSFAAARGLRTVLAHLPPEVVNTALIEEFPWVDALPEPERLQFAHDFVRAFQASAELGNWSLLDQAVREWRSTAAVHADPDLRAALTGPLDDDLGAVTPPMGE
ncbi:hypothetical protein [Actinokineospora terrae]|uniref:Prevent-host-death family protein n=1 Tax=Actinokineospora terrae TaxID=155974 RepID=A0A1H9XRV1_9PSEU|nr:hypothetical protein [Actinokineospora terrae]SES48872.1 hypothetical protein SAMN04487818_12312 [Actinokineospora terrae]